jgi:hypothetical protein
MNIEQPVKDVDLHDAEIMSVRIEWNARTLEIQFNQGSLMFVGIWYIENRLHFGFVGSDFVSSDTEILKSISLKKYLDKYGSPDRKPDLKHYHITTSQGGSIEIYYENVHWTPKWTNESILAQKKNETK